MFDGRIDDIVFHAIPVGIPNGASIVRLVDEGVAVVLNTINDVVSGDFLFADGVLFAPTHQHLDGPLLDDGFIGHAATAPIAIFAVVAYTHVHQGAREVAFVLVDRFENGASIAQRRFASP